MGQLESFSFRMSFATPSLSSDVNDATTKVSTKLENLSVSCLNRLLLAYSTMLTIATGKIWQIQDSGSSPFPTRNAQNILDAGGIVSLSRGLYILLIFVHR